MKPPPDPHYRHRFPAEIISHAVWQYVGSGQGGTRKGNLARHDARRKPNDSGLDLPGQPPPPKPLPTTTEKLTQQLGTTDETIRTLNAWEFHLGIIP